MNLLKKYPLIKHILLIIGVFVILFFLTFMILQKYSRHGKEYTLSDLIDKSIVEVQEMEEMSLFEVILMDSVYVNNKQGGIILAMDPPAQSKVKSGRKVYVTITSFEPEDVEMPNLIDLTVRQAVSSLESHGLYCGRLTFKPDIGKNAVLEQLYQSEPISPRTKIARHSQIDLIVGSGVDTTSIPLTSVPLIIGKTPQEAKRALNIASLNVGKEHYDKGANENNARVKKQSPGYIGRPVVRLGAPVEIWYVADGKEDFDKIIKQEIAKPVDTTLFEVEQENLDTEVEEEPNW